MSVVGHKRKWFTLNGMSVLLSRADIASEMRNISRHPGSGTYALSRNDGGEKIAPFPALRQSPNLSNPIRLMLPVQSLLQK
jgi:hypothetical protein